MRRFSWDKIASVATRTANSLNIFQAISRRHARMQFEADLQSIMPHSKSLVSQPVLLDGTWDNPNYWLRVQLLLSALGIRKSGMHGLLGPHNARQQAATMRGMGLSTFHDLSNRP